MKKNTGTDYEKTVQNIYQAFLNYGKDNTEFESIFVQHNIVLTGKSGVTHQIDIYWKFALAGAEYQTIVEVKDWKTPVKKEQLLCFNSLLQDISGYPKGIYVSRSGFQAGAIEYAKMHGIQLIQITNKECYEIINLHINNIITHYDNVYLIFDDSLCDRDLLYDENEKFCVSDSYINTVLINSKGEKVLLCDLMYKEAEPYYWNSEGVITEIEKELDGNWYWDLEHQFGKKVPIIGYGFVCYNTTDTITIEVTTDNFADYILTDILTKHKNYYNSKEKQMKFSCMNK